MVVVDNKLVRRSASLTGVKLSYDEAMSVGAVSKTMGFIATHPSNFFEVSSRYL